MIINIFNINIYLINSFNIIILLFIKNNDLNIK